MTAPCAKDALFCFATGGFNVATRKSNLNTPAGDSPLYISRGVGL